MKGRKKIPTSVKQLKGTLEKSRLIDNEMQTTQVITMPEAPFLNYHREERLLSNQ